MNFRPPRIGEVSRSRFYARALRRRGRAVFVIGVACTLIPFFACAESADIQNPDAGGLLPDVSVLPESAVPDDVTVPEDAPVDAIVSSPCSAGGFCPVPVPTQKPVWAVSGSSLDDVWAIGSEGSGLTYGHDAILRWDGAAWKVVYQSSMRPTRTKGFHGIWAPKPDKVWVAGEGIFHYSAKDGVRQLPLPNPPGSSFVFTAGWATPESDALWAVGGKQDVLRFREEPAGTLVADRWIPQMGAEDSVYGYRWSGIWGFGPDDIYVGGKSCVNSACNQSRGALAHYDGTVWSVTVITSDKEITSIFGTPPGEPRHLWITTSSLPGASVPPTKTELVPVMNDGSIGAPLFTQSMTNSTSVGAVRGSVVSPNVAWISDGVFVWRWTGTQLELMPTSIEASSVGRVLGVWAASTDDVWIVGESMYGQTPFATQYGMSRAMAALRKGGSAPDGGQP